MTLAIEKALHFESRLERAVRLSKCREPTRSQYQMRPLTILLGIVMGSTVSLAVGLLMTWIVILFLPQDAARFAPERAPLLEAIVLFTALAAAASASFYGDLRTRAWRMAAHSVTVALVGATIWLYWPT